MKNIAIPLLLAGSAKAEAKKKAAMLQDYAYPEPILIASSWTGEVCEDEDGDVAAALTALSTAEGTVTTLEEDLEALEEAVATAAEDRLEAVEAVLDLDATMEADVAANNSAILALLGLKESWQEASVTASIGQADVAAKLQTQSDAQTDYNNADTAYGTSSTGALGTWTTDDGLKTAAISTETGAASVAGSIDYRNAAHINYAAINCTEVALTDATLGAGVSGAVGDSGFEIQCAGTYSTALATDYSDYVFSLAELETAVNDKLALKNTAELTKAAKNLLKTEYNQLQKYVGYAKDNAETDYKMLKAVAKFDLPSNDADYTLNHVQYIADRSLAANLVATYVDVNAAMQAGNGTLDVSTTTATATIDSKAKAWVAKLQLVYGTMTGSSVSANVQNDGNDNQNAVNGSGVVTPVAGTVDSAEYTIRSGAAATSYDAWVTSTRLQVQGTRTYFNAYNGLANAKTLAAGELGSDGYTSAYTEVKGSTSGGPYTGKCTTATGGTRYAFSLTSGTDWVDSVTMVIGFQGDASSDSDIGAASDDGGASVCAKQCSAKLPWLLATSNLPYTMLADSGTSTLTTNDAAAITASTTTMTNAQCIGFEVGATGVASNGDQLTCYGYFGAFPTGNTDQGSDSTTNACYTRNISVAADTYSKTVVPTVAGAGTSDWDYFSAAIGVWGTAFQNLIDARAELDIATYYYGLINPLYTDTTDSTSDNVLDSPGFKEQYNWNDGTADTGHLPDYTAASTAYTNATTDYTTAETAYSDRAVLIASANSDYLLAQAQLDENNALISKLTILTEISLAASNAASQAKDDAQDALDDATDDWEAARDAYSGVAAADPDPAVEGYAELQTAAEEDYEAAALLVYGDGVDPNPEGSNTALGVYADGGAAPLGTLFALRADAATKLETFEEAVDELADKFFEIEDAQIIEQEKLDLHLLAIVACKVENYNNYLETLQLAEQQREEDLDDILALVTADEDKAPAAGAANSRCEKALSNGTFRPQRGETTCNEGLCCGAARIQQGDVMMTIETCQAEGTTEYSYVAPRAPMATTAPEPETVPFVCIEGAKKLAAAASALATAVYMLA